MKGMTVPPSQKRQRAVFIPRANRKKYSVSDTFEPAHTNQGHDFQHHLPFSAELSPLFLGLIFR